MKQTFQRFMEWAEENSFVAVMFLLLLMVPLGLGARSYAGYLWAMYFYTHELTFSQWLFDVEFIRILWTDPIWLSIAGVEFGLIVLILLIMWGDGWLSNRSHEKDMEVLRLEAERQTAIIERKKRKKAGKEQQYIRTRRDRKRKSRR